MSDVPEAGWYPNPQDPTQQRYWDGTGWTDHTAPLSGPIGETDGGPVGHGDRGRPPDPWLWQSIVATLLCCLPVGVAGIVFASQSQSAAAAGDLATARRKADQARLWTLVAVGIGAVGTVLGVVLFVAGVLGAGI